MASDREESTASDLERNLRKNWWTIPLEQKVWGPPVPVAIKQSSAQITVKYIIYESSFING